MQPIQHYGRPWAANPELIPYERRRAALAQAVAVEVARGGRVETHGDVQAVIVRGRRPNHLLHFLVSMCTFGAWIFVWIGLSIFGGEKRVILLVDDYGNVRRER